MENIYKYLYKDEEGQYFFATDSDTRQVIDQQSYILIYILEVLMDMKAKEEEKEIFLSNEEVEDDAKMQSSEM